MKTAPRFFLFVVLSPLLLVSPARTEDPEAGRTLEEISTEAFLALMDGDELLDTGNPREALEKYRESLERYRALRERDAEYKPKSVTYRMEELEEKMAQARAMEEPEPTASPEAPPNASDPSFSPEDYKTLYLQTREKMLDDAERLLKLERAKVQADRMLAEARSAARDLRAELNTVRKKLADTHSETGTRLSDLEKENRDLARFNELLKERADKVEADQHTLETRTINLRRELADRQEVLENLQEQLETTRKELAAEKLNANQGEQRLILERNQLRDDLKEANRQWEQARKRIATMEEQLRELPRLEETVAELTARNETRETKIETLEARVAEARQAVSAKETAEARLAELQGELGGKAVELEELRRTVAPLEKELESTREELARARATAEKRDRAATDAETRLAKAEQEQWANRDRIKALEQRIQDLQKQERSTSREADEWEEKATVLAKEVTRLREERAELQARVREVESLRGDELKTHDKLQTLQSERDRLKLNLKQEKESRQQLKKTVDQQLAAITDRMNEIITLRAKLAKAEEEIAQLTAE